MVPNQKVRRLDPRSGRATVEERAASSQITQEDLMVIQPTPESYLDDDEHVIAAQRSPETTSTWSLLADLDFLSDLYYEQQESLEQQLDNLSLLQNSIEVLAGDTGFVKLRNRRPTPRTLTQVEARIEEIPG